MTVYSTEYGVFEDVISLYRYMKEFQLEEVRVNLWDDGILKASYVLDITGRRHYLEEE